MKELGVVKALNALILRAVLGLFPQKIWSTTDFSRSPLSHLQEAQKLFPICLVALLWFHRALQVYSADNRYINHFQKFFPMDSQKLECLGLAGLAGKAFFLVQHSFF